MRRRFASVVMVGMLVAGGLVATGSAQDEAYVEVDVQELIDNPQNYWAVGIVFTDKLLSSPSGRGIRIGSDRFYPFETERLEMCYADEKVAPRLEVSKLDANYIFSGTVLQRSRKYYVVVRDLQPAAVDEESMEALLARLSKAGDEGTAKRVVSVLDQAEQALFAFVQERGLQGQSLLTQKSPHRKEALQVIRATVASAEAEYETTARELLTQFIEMIMIESTLRSGQEPGSPAGAEQESGPLDDGAVVVDVRPVEPGERPATDNMNAAVGWGERSEPAGGKPSAGYQLKLMPYNARLLNDGAPASKAEDPKSERDGAVLGVDEPAEREVTIREIPVEKPAPAAEVKEPAKPEEPGLNETVVEIAPKRPEPEPEAPRPKAPPKSSPDDNSLDAPVAW
jgi:hypothetical protein